MDVSKFAAAGGKAAPKEPKWGKGELQDIQKALVGFQLEHGGSVARLSGRQDASEKSRVGEAIRGHAADIVKQDLRNTIARHEEYAKGARDRVAERKADVEAEAAKRPGSLPHQSAQDRLAYHEKGLKEHEAKVNRAQKLLDKIGEHGVPPHALTEKHYEHFNPADIPRDDHGRFASK